MTAKDLQTQLPVYLEEEFLSQGCQPKSDFMLAQLQSDTPHREYSLAQLQNY